MKLLPVFLASTFAGPPNVYNVFEWKTDGNSGDFGYILYNDKGAKIRSSSVKDRSSSAGSSLKISDNIRTIKILGDDNSWTGYITVKDMNGYTKKYKCSRSGSSKSCSSLSKQEYLKRLFIDEDAGDNSRYKSADVVCRTDASYSCKFREEGRYSIPFRNRIKIAYSTLWGRLNGICSNPHFLEF